MTLTLPMAMIGEGGVKSGDAGREDGCSTWTWGRVDVVGTSSSTSCGPAGAGKGTGRFVPLRDPLAFAFKASGVSTRTATPLPLAARRARTGRDGGGDGEAGGGGGEADGSAMGTADTQYISTQLSNQVCAPSSVGAAACGTKLYQRALGRISPK